MQARSFLCHPVAFRIASAILLLLCGCQLLGQISQQPSRKKPSFPPRTNTPTRRNLPFPGTILLPGQQAAHEQDSEHPQNVLCYVSPCSLHLPNTKVHFTLLIGTSEQAGHEVELQEIEAAIAPHQSNSLWKGNISLATLKLNNIKRADVIAALDEDDPTHNSSRAQVLRQGLQLMQVSFDLTSVASQLEANRTYPIRILARISVDGVSRVVQVPTQVGVLPAIASDANWHAGDGHMHTDWSDGSDNFGWSNTIANRMEAAHDAGLEWIAISDHTQQINGTYGDATLSFHGVTAGVPTGHHGDRDGRGLAADEFQSYWDEIEKQMSLQGYKVAVLAGMEYSTKDPRKSAYASKADADKDSNYHDAHFLAYGLPRDGNFLDDPLPWDAAINRYTGQYLLDELVKKRGAIGVIAHPYSGAYPWFHDHNTDFPQVYREWDFATWDTATPVGMELMTGSEFLTFNINVNTQQRWDALLAQGRKVFGMASSDAHWLNSYALGQYWTHVYVDPKHLITPQAIQDGVRAGRTIASTGPFLNMTIGSQGIGDTVIVNKGDKAKVRLSWKYRFPAGKVMLTYKTGGEVKTCSVGNFDTHWEGGNFVGTKEFEIPDSVSTNGYVRAWCEIHSTAVTILSAVYTSPIYIQAKASDPPPPPPTGKNDAAFVKDVTIQDGTTLNPNQAFVKTWLIKNTGKTTWGAGYKWVFVSGDKMSGPDFINVPAVKPGDTWDPSVNLTAPGSPGTYRGNWMMQAPDGSRFGTQMYVLIKVVVAAKDDAAFVSDITIPDGTVLAPGQSFVKTWRIKNTGNTNWGAGYHWTFDGGDKMSGPDALDVPSVKPGDTWDPSVSLTAPNNVGSYRGFWRMQNSAGTKFGTRVWVDIKVAVSNVKTVVSESDAAPREGAAGFWRHGTPQYWHDATDCGDGGHMLWTWNNDAAHGIDNMGDWRPNLPETANYEVFVFIPHNHAYTKDAHYELYTADDRRNITLNQSIYNDQWVSLGTYRFNQGADGFLRLIDQTNEKYITKQIGFDTAKWERR